MNYESIIYKTSVYIEPDNGFINIKKVEAHKTNSGYSTQMILHKRISFSDMNVIKKDVVRDTYNSLSRYAFTESEEAARNIALELMKDLVKVTDEALKNMTNMNERLNKKIDVSKISIEEISPKIDSSKFKFTEDML